MCSSLYLKDGEVEVWGVAACLVSRRAGVQGVELVRLGGRPVDNPRVNESLTHEVIHCRVEVKTVQISGDAAALILTHLQVIIAVIAETLVCVK